MRLVLDTNVVVSAMLWNGMPRLLLDAARRQRVELFTSLPMLAELAEILERRKFEKKIAASLSTIDQLVIGYARLTMIVRPLPLPRIAPDPDDDVVVATALAADANLLVTGDGPLLSVGHYQDFRIVHSRDAITLIEASRS